ncbi:MAG: glutaredoxin 3 [Gammaproteobacteria bacterium]|nr:glutaredoxin 3 [Gammaproteobacteria bacterium]
MARVEIYTTPSCPYCVQAKRLLTKKGVNFIEYAVASDAALRREMETRSGRSSVPQIFIDDTHVGGCDDLYDLEGDDKLDALLGLAGK